MNYCFLNKNFISTANELTVNSTNFLQKVVDFSPNLWYRVVTQEVGYKKTNHKGFAYVNIGADEGSQTPVTALARPYSNR